MTTPADVFRRRRCLALQLAIVFGILLPLFTRTWISLAVGLAGIALAAAAYRRDCRDPVTKPERSDTHTRAGPG